MTLKQKKKVKMENHTQTIVSDALSIKKQNNWAMFFWNGALGAPLTQMLNACAQRVA